nr:translation initiation factor IF-2-like [Pongo pygmaeus]
MAISGGPRRLAGLQRTPAAYANEAALAISGRAGEEGAAAPRDPGARCPAPPHIAGSGAALLGRPRCGSGGVRSVCAAARAPPPPRRRRRRAAPPGASGRGQGSDPAPLSRPGRSGAAPPAPGARGRPAAFAAPPRLSAPLSAAGPLGLRCPPLSGPSRPAPRPFRGLPPAAGRARRLAAGAERSAHAGVAGLRQDQLSGSEAARAARLLPSPPSPAFPLPSTPPSPRPPTRGPPRLWSARPARCLHRGRLAPAPARLGLCAAGGFLNTGKGGDRRAAVFPTLVPVHHGPPPGASGVGSERDRKFQLYQSPARGPPRSRDFGDDTGASGPVWCEPSAQMASGSFPESFAGGSGR